MRVAIVGSGISGLMAARTLANHGILATIYEASSQIGGHVKTLHDSRSSTCHELGVFMLDPKTIHPKTANLARSVGLDLIPLQLEFSYENESEKIHWSTASKWRPGILRNLSIFSNHLAQDFGKDHFFINNQFLIDVFFFLNRVMQAYKNPENLRISLQEFVEKNRISSLVVEYWLLPQIHCWWGVPKEVALSCSSHVIFDSIYKVNTNDQYLFKDGWFQFIDRISAPIKDQIRTHQPVEKVVRKEGRPHLMVNNKLEPFDCVILATPPSVSLNLLASPTSEEQNILSSFTTATTEVFTHTDPNWMPKKQTHTTVNLVKDEKGEYCTFWSGNLHPSKPPVYITWAQEFLTPIPEDQILSKDKWLRTLPTLGYAKACHEIDRLQGEGGVWYCGAHVHALGNSPPSLWHENALLSGEMIANKLLDLHKRSNANQS